MKGTTIKDLKLTKVVDGDTVKIMLDDKEESLRLVCLDTEESRTAGGKPATNAGKLASQWAKEYFGVDEKGVPTSNVLVTIEFDTKDPVSVCLQKHRGNYGRLICYVYKGDENYNLKAVREGWSPYFVKYGRSRLYHSQFISAEADAQSKQLAIWDPNTNAGSEKRDYEKLIPWWNLRDSVVQDYRHIGKQAGVLSVRLDYDTIVKAAKDSKTITVFCDLQGGINKWVGDNALIYAGSKYQKFNLWIPDINSDAAQEILQLIQLRYVKYGRSYVYVSGEASLYPERPDGKPQIVLTDVRQLSDIAPEQ
ncbi:MAG: thermonuclease family protein [Calothrix sp. MO_192.B10]|nr:thermonuclease family protein [Calothrix sp. MO_192.B10]